MSLTRLDSRSEKSMGKQKLRSYGSGPKYASVLGGVGGVYPLMKDIAVMGKYEMMVDSYAINKQRLKVESPTTPSGWSSHPQPLQVSQRQNLFVVHGQSLIDELMVPESFLARVHVHYSRDACIVRDTVIITRTHFLSSLFGTRPSFQ